jgi:tripartite-type tricarboxylate transporter receptor subunit TctC
VGGPADMDPALAQWWAEKFEQALTSAEWKAYVEQNMMLENFRALDAAGAYFKEQQAIFRELLTAVGMAKG